MAQAGVVAASIDALERCDYFLALIGNRWRTVCPPDRILHEVFEEARKQRSDLVTSAYVLDETTNPSVYRLRARHFDPVTVSALTACLEAAAVPSAGDSVTAREIQHAAFTGVPGHFRCFFYLRNSPGHTHPSFPSELVPVFDESDSGARAGLSTLRHRLLDEAHGVVRRRTAITLGVLEAA